MKVAIIYNEPRPDRYNEIGESKAEEGVLDEFRAVNQALVELGYSSIPVPLLPPLEQVKQTLKSLNVDVIFNLFEGFDGSPETEGQVASMLEELRIPFTGCPAAALTLALDKAKAKELLTQAVIPTPGFQILNPQNRDTFHLKYPCIVKPVNEDASHGLSEESVVYDFQSLKKQIEKISHLFGGKTMVEEYIDGREFNTTVMGNDNDKVAILGISEIVFTLPADKPRILTFESKWEENSIYYKHTKAVCPAWISTQEQEQISDIAKAAFKLVGCRGYARVDFRQDQEGNFKVLEINPNPDISLDAGAALQAELAGMTYNNFIEKIINLALNQIRVESQDNALKFQVPVPSLQ